MSSFRNCHRVHHFHHFCVFFLVFMNVFLFSVAQTVSNNNVSSFQNMHFEISGQMQCNEMRGIWNVNSSKNGTMRKFYNIQQFLFQINWKSVCLKNDCVKIKSNHFELDRSQMKNRTTVWMKHYKFVGKYWCWFKWIHHLAHSQRMRHTIATCATAFVVDCDAGHLNSSTLATANCTDNKSLIMKYIYKRHKYAMHFPVWIPGSSNAFIHWNWQKLCQLTKVWTNRMDSLYSKISNEWTTKVRQK